MKITTEAGKRGLQHYGGRGAERQGRERREGDSGRRHMRHARYVLPSLSSSSSSDRGQSDFKSLESALSFNNLPSVWQVGQ